MSGIIFGVGEFVFNLTKALAAYELIRANATAKCSEKTEQIAKWLIAIASAVLPTWNTVGWGYLFSNSMLWTAAVIMIVGVRLVYRIKVLEGISVLYLFWVAIHLVDFLIQSVVYYLLTGMGGSGLFLLRTDWIRGLYLILLSVGCVWLSSRLKDNPVLFRGLRRSKLYQILGIVLATFLLVYFQRIYIFLVSDQYVALWIVFVLAAIIIGCAMVVYSQKNKQEEREKLQRIKLSMMEENYEQMIRMYKEKSVLIHDEKNHFQTIRELLYQDEKQKAIDYAEKIAGELERSGSRVWSGHPMLDLILNTKIDEAKKHLIDMDIKFDDMSGLVVDEIDICALISNLIDNAIEANLKIEWPDDRWIKFYGERKGDFWIINSSNPTIDKVKIEDGKPVTSKKDKGVHGFGTESIRRVLDKYNGDVNYRTEDKRFAVTLLLMGFH